ncbi:unnamed protein product [Cylindrotheca closterium]|uniref:Uncharacterized protein n=1 Tax=Cylindrotheca closterium TaxID=2856 RepID=A0AAD2FFZ8_9STRA|nr:unnamed protein product [Cylindrotheca closterium]
MMDQKLFLHPRDKKSIVPIVEGHNDSLSTKSPSINDGLESEIEMESSSMPDVLPPTSQAVIWQSQRFIIPSVAKHTEANPILANINKMQA